MNLDQERQHKHQKVSEYLESHKLDGVLLSRRCNFSWYSCGARNYVNNASEVGNCHLLVTRQGATVLTTNIEAVRMRQEDFAGGQAQVLEYPYYDAAAQAKVFREAIGSMRVAGDVALPWAQTHRLDSDFDRLRWALTDSEIERYRALCNDTVAAVEFVARDVQPGVKENELVGMMAGALMCSGSLPWVALVAGDERVERLRHPLPTDKAIRKQFMVVACAERGGLICACTRLASFGPIDDSLARKHQACVNVETAMILATRPGATLGDVYGQAQAAYAANGYPNEWQLHHQGGSCGYLPREIIATPNDATPVLANQAFAWNPSITGTKSEDTTICLPHSTELLASSTDWPMLEGNWNGKTLPRPAILVR